MARAAKVTETKALVNYDEELAKQAAAAAEQEKNVGGGAFFSTRSGVLSVDGQSMPNNEMAVLIVDVPLLPAGTLKELGLALIEKSLVTVPPHCANLKAPIRVAQLKAPVDG